MRGLRLARHPLHPALVHFPIAFWTASLATEGAVLAAGAAFSRFCRVIGSAAHCFNDLAWGGADGKAGKV